MNDASNESPTAWDGPRQIYCPRREPICTFTSLGGAGGDVIVRIETPDSRIRQKIAIIAVATGSAPPNVAFAGRGVTVWPYAVEDDEVRGGQGTPVADMISGVTKAAPLSIPVHAALGGWGREFVTIADAIETFVHVPVQAPGGVVATLYVQTRCQPQDFQIIPFRQWEEIRSALKISVRGFVRT